MPVWLEVKVANDNWQRTPEDIDSLEQAEACARAMIVCGVVTPEGVRIMWAADADSAPRARAIDVADWGLLRTREDLAG